MSDYTPLANNEKDYFMGDGQGAVVTVGKVEQGGDNVNRLVKLSDLAPAESVSDVTVGGTSVVSNGVAAVPAVPSASTLAGTGLTANNGALDVSNPVPSAGTNEHRGDVLTVDNTDHVVWAAPQGGGWSSMSIVEINNPTIESGNIVINAQNNTIYDVALPNGEYSDIQINPPTVASGEVIDFYVNLQNNESDSNSHYTWVNNMSRISDASDEGIYSTVEQYKLLFIHGFHKYYTLKTISTE